MLIFVLGITLPGPGPVFCLPTDYSVEQGTVSSEQTDSQSLHLHIDSDSTILNFPRFDIATPEAVEFHHHQLTPSSSALARVTGGFLSSIAGTLASNGQLLLVNPAGIHFAPTANVQVAGLVASTLEISNADFLQGKLQFQRLDAAAASVVNEGKIISHPGGLVALLGGGIVNTGSITAQLGAVALAAGEKITLSFGPSGELGVTVEDPLTQVAVDPAGRPLPAAIQQFGSISSSGGQVQVTARAAEGLFNQLVNQQGILEANSIVQQNGRIELVAEGGTLLQAGRIEAIGQGPGTRGGTVHLLGDRIALQGEGSIDVSGQAGGGNVRIGGEFQGAGPLPNALRTYLSPGSFIRADAITSGDGGRVIVWADEVTGFEGRIDARGGSSSGNGGFVEVSGKESLVFRGTVNLEAPQGLTGTLLLDPRDIRIANGSGGTHDGQLSDRTVLFGDVGLNTNITLSETTLEGLTSNIILQARRDIILNNLTTDGVLNLSNLTAGESVVFQAGRHITFNNASNQISTAGADLHLEADSPHSTLGAADGNGTLTLGRLNSSGGGITLIGANFAINDTIDAVSGDIQVALSQNGQPLGLGTIGGARLTDPELDRLLTTGTLTIGQATTRGTDGAGTGSVVRTVGAMTMDGLTQGSKNLSFVADSIDLGSVSTTGAVHLTAQAGSILDGNGSATNLTASGPSSLSAGGVVGTSADPLEVLVTGAPLGVSASSAVNGVSVDLSGTVSPSGTLDLNNTPPGQVIFNGIVLFPPPPPPPGISPAAPSGIPAQDFFRQLLSSLFAPGSQRRLRNIGS